MNIIQAIYRKYFDVTPFVIIYLYRRIFIVCVTCFYIFFFLHLTFSVVCWFRKVEMMMKGLSSSLSPNLGLNCFLNQLDHQCQSGGAEFSKIFLITCWKNTQHTYPTVEWIAYCCSFPNIGLVCLGYRCSAKMLSILALKGTKMGRSIHKYWNPFQWA